MFQGQEITAKPIDTINVVVSIPPQKFLVERVGGEHVRIDVMVGPGRNPETYEPTPRQMANLAGADIYFRICVPFENNWIDVISSVNRKLAIVECNEESQFRENGRRVHERNEIDPHVWTSPIKAKEIAIKIASELTVHDPYSRDYFSQNLEKLIADLDALDARIREKTKSVHNRYIIVSHASLGYFANRYGFKQIAIEQKGKEIQARALAELIQFARKENIRNILVQKQYRHNSAEILAREIDGIITEFDPLSEDYIENLDLITNAIVGKGK